MGGEAFAADKIGAIHAGLGLRLLLHLFDVATQSLVFVSNVFKFQHVFDALNEFDLIDGLG